MGAGDRSPTRSPSPGDTTFREGGEDRYEHTGRLKRKSRSRSRSRSRSLRDRSRGSGPKRRRTRDSQSPGPSDRHGRDEYHYRWERDSYSPRQRDYHSPEPSRPRIQERKQPITQEEKKRGRRLFGGLLSTLSQKTTSTHQKRRQEIEKRQQERAKRQQAENEKHRAERVAKVQSIRKAEQDRTEEKMMHIRHRQALALARFLKTKSEPPIYYLPYDELTLEQEDTIGHEVERVEAFIESEVEAFQRRKAERSKPSSSIRHSSPRATTIPRVSTSCCSPAASETQNPNMNSPGHQYVPEATSKGPPEAAKNNDDGEFNPANKTQAADMVKGVRAKPSAHSKDHADDSGDVVLEAEEDTVIY
ncbi:hypothetical protein MKZ38_004633 [Zalerion maritima]|uniref:Pinin/SDK/MemA protein domain-containing protein n=1 Tax=Zalerion maritima TaxID=339359 RepID=A0AAD5RMD3_9PEZI|nr:hypothetical protein MKZ38_004633 [Zalerion maritima]